MEQIATGALMGEMQDAICSLKDVLYAQCVAGSDGSISEIHIVSGMTRGAKQIARDVESLLLARFSVRIDHKMISVAQIEQPQPAKEPVLKEFRLACEGFSISVRNRKVQGTVLLSYRGKQYQGISTGALAPLARDRVLVEATLDAVHKYIGRDAVFVLTETKTVVIANMPVMLVSLNMTDPAQSDLLIGASLLRDDVQMSLVKATLCAVNRRLALFAREVQAD